MALRPVPWLVLLQAVMAVRSEWDRLDTKDRARLAEIVRDAKTTRSLSPRDKDDLRRIAGAIDKGSLARAMLSARGGHGRRRGPFGL